MLGRAWPGLAVGEQPGQAMRVWGWIEALSCTLLALRLQVPSTGSKTPLLARTTGLGQGHVLIYRRDRGKDQRKGACTINNWQSRYREPTDAGVKREGSCSLLQCPGVTGHSPRSREYRSRQAGQTGCSGD